VVLKNEIVPEGEATIFRLSGRIDSQQLQYLQRLTALQAGLCAICMKCDLSIWTQCFSSQSAKKKESSCGICPSYIREWIFTEKTKISQCE